MNGRRGIGSSRALAGVGTVVLLGLAVGLRMPTAVAEPARVKVPKVKSSQLPEAVGPPVGRAHTVYMNRGPEKERAAANMNELHAVMAARGFTFVDKEPHSENGDLQGWWLTYVVTGATPMAVAPVSDGEPG